VKFRHKVSGDDGLRSAFTALPTSVTHDTAVEALLKAVEPIRAMAATRAPRGDGAGPHLADHIVAAETTRVGTGRGARAVAGHEHVVVVGPSYRPEDVFWGTFQELGTATHPAQPFLRPAFRAGIRQAQRILGRELWAAIRARLRRAA
jgi:HK97 gp10 family phage protein